MPFNKLVQKLMTLKLFSSFPEDDLKSLLDTNTHSVKKYEKGEVIFTEGDTCRSIFIILDGTVIIEKTDVSGRYLTVGEASKGDMMGPNVLFSKNSIYPLSTRAKDNVELFIIPKDFLLMLCQKDRVFLEEVLRITSSRAFMLTRRLSELSVRTLRQNIMGFLLTEIKRTGNNFIRLPFTKKAWAENLGVQRPSLSRELKKLQDEGIIESEGSSIKVINPGKLEIMEEF